MLKDGLIILGTTVVVSALAYYFCFPALFAHTAFEVFWYAALYGIPNFLAVMVGKMFGREKVVQQTRTTTSTVQQPAMA